MKLELWRWPSPFLRRRAAELEAELHIEFRQLLYELERANPRVLRTRYI